MRSAGIIGCATDTAERISDLADDPESRPASHAEPQYQVSATLTCSRARVLYVYHFPDDQLGRGASFGNGRARAETYGNGSLLRFFSIDIGKNVFGGMSI